MEWHQVRLVFQLLLVHLVVLVHQVKETLVPSSPYFCRRPCLNEIQKGICMKMKLIALDWQWVTLIYWCQYERDIQRSPHKNKIEIWPIDALFEVLELTTFSIYFVFNLSEVQIWVTFHFEWHPSLSDIPFWVTFHFEWHSILRDVPV